MRKLIEWIKKHQLIAFFSLTYLLAWGLMAPYMLEMGEIFEIVAIVGLFGPALANIIISRLVSQNPTDNPRTNRWITFLATWIIATTIFTLYVKISSGIDSPFVIVVFGLFGLLPAFVWSSAFSKFPQVQKSLSSLVKPQGHIGYYLFAFLIPPLIKVVSIPINDKLGLSTLSDPVHYYEPFRLASFVVVSFLYGFLFAGGLNEEVGWTGFALPKLQEKYNPLISSMILWFFWILWHMPMQVTGFWNPETEAFIRAVIGTFFARFIFTWLYNKTKGGIIPAMIFHVSANVSFMLFPATPVQMALEAVLAIVIVVTAKMWIKLPNERLIENQSIEETALPRVSGR